MNPKDAKELNLQDGDLIKVSSTRGEIESKVLITDTIREKTVFIPVSNRNINYLTNDLLDKESFQPDYNHSAVNIKKL